MSVRPDEEIFELETALAHLSSATRELEEVIARAWDAQRRHIVPSGLLLADALAANRELEAAQELIRRVRSRGTRYERVLRAQRT